MGKSTQIPPTADTAAAEYVSLTALKPWAKNPKTIEPADVRELARSIKRFGFGPPIVARKENGEIIAGHLRYAAAKQLRLERVPVRFMDLSEGEAHAMALADTKLHERRTFEDDALAEVLEEMQADGVDLTMGTGFDDDELDKILADAGSEREWIDSGGRADDGRSSPKLGGLSYRVVVDCEDERHQAELLGRLEGEGLKCRPLMS